MGIPGPMSFLDGEVGISGPRPLLVGWVCPEGGYV